jgi:hypothetical protein
MDPSTKKKETSIVERVMEVLLKKSKHPHHWDAQDK